MKYKIHDVEQRSAEWYALRAGLLTGSVAADMLARIKTGEAAARRDLRVKLAVERLTTRSLEDDYINKEMQRGIDMEPAARGAYEAATGHMVQTCGFLSVEGIMVGCSLDGYVGDMVGIQEFKVPKSATHLKYLRGGVVPSDHLPQLRHNLWVSGAQWADFVSYDDRFPEDLQMFIARLTREEAALDEYEQEVRKFLAEVSVEVNEIQAMRSAA